jgi:hypothetical protein
VVSGKRNVRANGWSSSCAEPPHLGHRTPESCLKNPVWHDANALGMEAFGTGHSSEWGNCPSNGPTFYLDSLGRAFDTSALSPESTRIYCPTSSRLLRDSQALARQGNESLAGVDGTDARNLVSQIAFGGADRRAQ